MKLRYDNSVPVYAFNLTDYLLWRNREKLRSIFTTIKFDDFRFTYRRSIEHWYPQNPNETEGKTKLSDDLLHCFGNLCLIVASQNSAFGNLYPLAKLANWREIFNTQSLKLQMMAVNTHTWSSWDETKRTEILAMEEDIMQMLENYMYENLQGDKPYKDGEKLYLDVEQIIPIKDIGDYQIHLTAKKQEETVSSIEEAARHETRYKFWEKALPVLRVKTGAYSNVSPSKDNWLTGASGHRGVSFNPIILMGGARAELYIDTGNEQWNTSIFEKLKSKETEIDSSFLGMVIWQELPGKRARRICVQYHDYGLNNDEHWDDIIDWLSNNIAALMKVLKPLLDVIMKSVE